MVLLLFVGHYGNKDNLKRDRVWIMLGTNWIIENSNLFPMINQLLCEGSDESKHRCIDLWLSL